MHPIVLFVVDMDPAIRQIYVPVQTTMWERIANLQAALDLTKQTYLFVMDMVIA